MNALSQLLNLSVSEKQERGLLYTPAEIAQQPVTWLKTQQIFHEQKKGLKEFLAPALEGGWTVFLVGAGSSDYVGGSLAHLLRRSWGCEVWPVASTDLLTNREDLLVEGRKYLWISFSRSGDSPEGVAVLEQSIERDAGVRHLVVSCNEKARMVEMARASEKAYAVVLDDAVNDRSLAMTSSFTNMVVFGQMLADLFRDEGYAGTLDRMVEAAAFLLEQGADVAYELAQQGYRSACYVGAGSLAATAKEAALKLLELTAGQVPTMSETTLGLRHGPMSSLNQETLFTMFLSGEERRGRYDRDLLRELKRKQVVKGMVCVGGTDDSADICLNHASFAGIGDGYRPAVDILFGQMVGLFGSIKKGMKPDAPSPAGVISRVVQGFAIYA